MGCKHGIEGACTRCGEEATVQRLRDELADKQQRINDLEATLELWAHESRLQTFENREAFRRRVAELLDGPSGVGTPEGSRNGN